MGTRTSIWAAGAALATMLGSALIFSPAAGAASSPADQGVTAKTIAVGLPYVNFEALKSLGVTINDGSFPDAYNGVIGMINAAGGGQRPQARPLHGRDEPVGTGRRNVIVHPAHRGRPRLRRHRPGLPGLLPGDPRHAGPHGIVARHVAGFGATRLLPHPPDANFDPLQLAAFKKAGDFKGKKVAIFYGADSDAPEVKVVQQDLKKLGVPVALTAEDSVQATDAVASDQEVQSISQRFQSAGVNVVIGVGGSGSTTWPRAQLDNQSTYKPLYIATSESSLISYVESTKGANPYLKYVLAASSAPTLYQQWKDPAIQKCVAAVNKAYPSDTITPPVNPTSPGAGNSTDTTYTSVIEACQYMALFDDIAAAAGKNLTVASFTKAGYTLKNADIPGIGSVSFGPGQPYATEPVTILKY